MTLDFEGTVTSSSGRELRFAPPLFQSCAADKDFFSRPITIIFLLVFLYSKQAAISFYIQPTLKRRIVKDVFSELR